MTNMKFPPKNYDMTAWFYETVARVYSFGAIPSVKLAEAHRMKPDDRCLVVGCGAGEDVVEFARHCKSVTAIDLSSKMLRRLEKRIERLQITNVNVVQADVHEYETDEPFDVVTANFFLNLWREEKAIRMAENLRRLLRDDGRLMVADWASICEQDRWLARWIKHFNYRIGNLFYGSRG